MKYFADTSFWLALLSRRDAHHLEAVRCRKEVGSNPIVTTDLVLWEVLNCCSGSPLRQRSTALFDGCLKDSQIQVVWTSRDLLLRGVDLYKSRADKQWGLTDCVSFVVMKDGLIQEALTSDHHFQQAGFRVRMEATS